MADKMKNLSLCNLSSSDQELSSLPDIVLSTAKRDICDGLHDEYSRLKEIESRFVYYTDLFSWNYRQYSVPH